MCCHVLLIVPCILRYICTCIYMILRVHMHIYIYTYDYKLILSIICYSVLQLYFIYLHLPAILEFAECYLQLKFVKIQGKSSSCQRLVQVQGGSSFSTASWVVSFLGFAPTKSQQLKHLWEHMCKKCIYYDLSCIISPRQAGALHRGTSKKQSAARKT